MNGEPFDFVNWSRGQPNNWGGNSDFGNFYADLTSDLASERRGDIWDDSQITGGAPGFMMEIE